MSGARISVARGLGVSILCLGLLFLSSCGGGGGGEGGNDSVATPGAGPSDSGSIPPAGGTLPPAGLPGGGDPAPDPVPDPDPIPDPDPVVVPDPPPVPAPIPVPPMPDPLPWWPLTDVHASDTDPLTGDVYYLDLQGRMFMKTPGDSIPVEIANTDVLGAKGLARASLEIFYAVVDSGGGVDDVLMRIDLSAVPPVQEALLVGFADVEGLTLIDAAGTPMLCMVDPVAGRLISYVPATSTLADVELGGAVGEVRGLAFDPVELALVAIDNASGRVLAIDPASGAVRFLRDQAAPVDGLAFDPLHGHYHAPSAGAGEVHEIDLKGVDADIGSMRGLAHDPDRDTLLGSHVTTTWLVEITRSSGWKRVIGYTGIPDVEGLAYDDSGDRLFGVSRSTQRLYELSTGDGSATPIGPVSGPAGPWASLSGLAFGRGVLFAVDTDTSDILQIDPATAGAQLLASLAVYPALHGLAFDPNGPGEADDELVSYDDLLHAPVVMQATFPAGAVLDEPAPVDSIGGLAWVPDGPQVLGTDLVGNRIVTILDETPPSLGYDDVRALGIAPDQTVFGADLATEALFEYRMFDGSTADLAFPPMQVEALAYDLGSLNCYAVDVAAGNLIELDPVAQVIVRIVGAAPAGVRALAYDLVTARLYAVDSDTDELLQIDPSDGSTISVQADPMIFDTIEGLVFVDAELFGFDRATRSLVLIDPNTGACAPFPPIGDTTVDIACLAFDLLGNTLVAMDRTSDRLVKIDRLTGQIVP